MRPSRNFALPQIAECAVKYRNYLKIVQPKHRIPQNYVEAILGGKNPFGVIMAVAAGTPMYADIFGTIPVAEALLGKGAQLGTILAFMMAVTTLSLPSMIMLSKVMKARLLALFIGICVLGIIIVGYLFNAFQSLLM